MVLFFLALALVVVVVAVSVVVVFVLMAARPQFLCFKFLSFLVFQFGFPFFFVCCKFWSVFFLRPALARLQLNALGPAKQRDRARESE